MLVGNIYSLPYLPFILYWRWNITDISYSSFFTVQSPPRFCTGNTNLSSADLTESLLDNLLDHCSDWTMICFSEEYREMYAHWESTEHNHIDCMNKMPIHFSWKVNIWSLPLPFSLKSHVLLKSYTTLSGFPFTKGKDYGRILLAVPLNSRGQRVCMQPQICKNNNTTNLPTN